MPSWEITPGSESVPDQCTTPGPPGFAPGKADLYDESDNRCDYLVTLACTAGRRLALQIYYQRDCIAGRGDHSAGSPLLYNCEANACRRLRGQLHNGHAIAALLRGGGGIRFDQRVVR